MLLSRKGVLAVAAVIDVALHAIERPVSAKSLANRQGLPPRHLEPVLQALVHEGILRGVRGPRGGYELGRDQHQITAVEILRAAGTAEEGNNHQLPNGTLVSQVILPTLSQAEHAFAAALGQIRVDELVRRASAARA